MHVKWSPIVYDGGTRGPRDPKAELEPPRERGETKRGGTAAVASVALGGEGGKRVVVSLRSAVRTGGECGGQGVVRAAAGKCRELAGCIWGGGGGECSASTHGVI